MSITSILLAQESDSTKPITTLLGSIGATHNGISLVPSFSLEKPAAIFNMSLAKGRFSFDPEFTFSWEGKPWYMLFWFRYKLVNAEKIRVKVGTHLGLNFITEALPINRNPNHIIITERYLVGELFPTYLITENISMGIYYLHARGFDIGTNAPMNFLALHSNFSNIRLGSKLFLNITPQIYYLYLYGEEGFYVTSAFTLAKRDFPLSLSSTINKVVKTEITAGNDFIWNITLTYSFGERRLVSGHTWSD